MSSREWARANELLAKANADPNWIRDPDERERVRLEKEAEYERLERPLAEALSAIGINVKSAWELYKVKPYPKAVPILLEHLTRPYPDNIRDGIARALGVPEARAAWSFLVERFRAERGFSAKQGLAAALAKIATEAHVEEVIALVRDRTLGDDRLLLLTVLDRSKNPRALETLEQLATDADLKKEIAHLLKRRERKQRLKAATAQRKS